MKNFILILSLLMGSLSFADTTDVAEILFSGNDTFAEANLRTEKTRTEYRTVTVPSICYRTEYRSRCSTGPSQCRRVCRNNRCRRVCTTPRRVCRRVPVQVSYRCMRQETRAYQVHDYFVETNAVFEFNNSDVSNDAREEFKLKMTGDTASLSVDSSKNYIIVLDDQARTVSREAGVKYVNLTYKVNFVPAQQLNSVLSNGIKNVSYRNGIVNFELGAGFNFYDFSQSIKLYRNRRLGSDVLLLDRVLAENDVNVQTTSSASIVSIDLKALGVNPPSNARVILSTEYKFNTNNVLNKNELKFSDTVNWVFR